MGGGVCYPFIHAVPIPGHPWYIFGVLDFILGFSALLCAAACNCWTVTAALLCAAACNCWTVTVTKFVCGAIIPWWFLLLPPVLPFLPSFFVVFFATTRPRASYNARRVLQEPSTTATNTRKIQSQAGSGLLASSPELYY